MINLAKPAGNDVSVHLPVVSTVSPKQQHWQPLQMRWKSEQIIASPYRAESLQWAARGNVVLMTATAVWLCRGFSSQDMRLHRFFMGVNYFFSHNLNFFFPGSIVRSYLERKSLWILFTPDLKKLFIWGVNLGHDVVAQSSCWITCWTCGSVLWHGLWSGK